jgi:hypothetical protein
MRDPKGIKGRKPEKYGKEEAMRYLRFALIPAVLFLFPGMATLLFAQWGPDVRLTFNPNNSYTTRNNARCLATGPGGIVHVVWADDRDGNFEIYYKRSTDYGTTWDSSDIRLTNAPDSSMNPSIAVWDSMVHLVWWDKRNGDNQLYYKRSTNNGLTWSPDMLLTTGYYPSLAVSDSIVYVVCHRDLPSENIYFKRSTDNGVSWSADTLLRSNPPYELLYPSIAAGDSNVHVAWEAYWYFRYPPVIETHYMHSTNFGKSWSSDIAIGQFDAMYPSIGFSGLDVQVVYEFTTLEIFNSCSTDGGITWSNTRLTYDPNASIYPNVAVSASNVHVVWADTRDGNGEIYYKRSFDSGNTWSSDLRLTYDTSGSGFPFIAVSGPMLHVVWEDTRDGNYEIYYKRNPTGNGVEMNEVQASLSPRRQLLASPNPFISSTSIPGHGTDHFDLYNVSGRLVGTYRGERIGTDVPPGVYFLRPHCMEHALQKIVKVR